MQILFCDTKQLIISLFIDQIVNIWIVNLTLNYFIPVYILQTLQCQNKWLSNKKNKATILNINTEVILQSFSKND